jgi:hypothetical protein
VNNLRQTNGRGKLTTALALASSLFFGCASIDAITTPNDEWIAYRKTRVSPTLEGRLVAADRYLARYPKGSFAKEVRGFFDTAEPLYFDQHRDRIEGLYLYLATLPAGPHEAEAKQRLFRLRERSGGPVGFDADALRTDARIGRLAKARAMAREAILGPLRSFLDRDVFERPLSQAKPDLLVSWSLSLPWPRCSLDEEAKDGRVRKCTKLLELPYEISTGEGAEERQATVEIVIEQDREGRPRRVTIGGPELFHRLEEIQTGRPVERGDTSAAAMALTNAVDLVRREFATNVSDDPACRKPSRGIALLLMSCDGLNLVVSPGLEPGEDDRVMITSL